MTPDEKAVLTAKLRGGVAERTPGISVDAKTRVVALASGKRGVGKSSLSANLAVAFSRLGYKAGVLDADVYGTRSRTCSASTSGRSRSTR